MNQIRLYYLTTNGCEWLEETTDVSRDNFKEVIRDYIERNGGVAERLERKWRVNGEDVSLFLEVDNVDSSPLFFNEIWNEVDNLS